MDIVDGKKISLEIIDGLKPFFFKRKTDFVVVSVGDNPEESESFVKEKKKVAELLGVEFVHSHFFGDVSSGFLRKKIGELVKKKGVNGMIVQLPISKELNVQYVLNAIPKEKDPDVLTEINLGSFVSGRLKILPPAVAVVDFILKSRKIILEGKNCVVVGNGRLVGMPIALWLKKQKATVTVLDEFSKEPEKYIKQADVLITGTGQAGLIDGKIIKDGVVAIDFGYSWKDGKLRGDIDFDSVSKKADLVTPTPGGTGPILVAMLYNNLKLLIEENEKRN